MGQYNVVSGIKVLDRAVSILMAVARQPVNLHDLANSTDIPRASAHRLASALETHQLLTRTREGLWTTGPAWHTLGGGSLIETATPAMSRLVSITGESVQLFSLDGSSRRCIAAQEPPSGLQNTVPVGSLLPLHSGSAARIFQAFAEITPTFTAEELAQVRRNHLAESIAEREVGLASLSAPILDSAGALLAVLSVSGPVERLPHPAKQWGTQLLHAAQEISGSLGWTNSPTPNY